MGIVIRTVVASVEGRKLTGKSRRKISRVMEVLYILIEVLVHRYIHLPKLIEHFKTIHYL